MKNILAILLLSFSLNALSCANSMPISTAIFAIENNGAGREKEMDCKKLPDEDCLCFDDISWEQAEIIKVDELDFIQKKQVESCEKLPLPEVIDGENPEGEVIDGENPEGEESEGENPEGEEPLPFNEFADCDAKFEALVCSEGEKIKNYLQLEVYCAVEVTKKVNKLVNSEVKKAQKKAEKEAKELAQEEKKAKKQAAKDKVKAFKFKGSTIKELRDELNEYSKENAEVVE